jgi:hypothetical protein
MFTWIEGSSSSGAASVASRAVRKATNSSSVDAVLHMRVVRALLGHRALPGVGVAAGAL